MRHRAGIGVADDIEIEPGMLDQQRPIILATHLPGRKQLTFWSCHRPFQQARLRVGG